MKFVKKLVKAETAPPGNCPLCGCPPLVYTAANCVSCSDSAKQCELWLHVFKRKAWDKLVAIRVAADKYGDLCR